MTIHLYWSPEEAVMNQWETYCVSCDYTVVPVAITELSDEKKEG